MPATVSADFVFEPKVWKEHIRAYFDRKLVYGAIAQRDDELKNEPGETINYPYFNKIGDAEEPLETAALTVDKLSDDSFSATVKEVGKAVGIKKKAFKVSAAKTDRVVQEVTEQLGRVHAEKIDKDLVAEMETVGNYTDVPSLGVGATIAKVMTGKVTAFGDKHTDAMAIQIHSLDLLSITTDAGTGFLKADATDPWFSVPGFRGRMLGMGVFEVDTVNGGVAGVANIHKMNPYGFIVKQDMELESDYDILTREWVFTSNEWYAVKSFHAKISADDKKSARLRFAV